MVTANFENRQDEEKKSGYKKLGAVLAAGAAFLTSGCFPSGEANANRPETPQATASQDPAASPEATNTPESPSASEIPTTQPSDIETTQPIAYDQPIVRDGPFGDEYPALPQEVLLPTTSIEEMEGMDWETFALLPIQDRLGYLFTKTVSAGEEVYRYFQSNENVTPYLIPDQWSKSRADAFFEGTSPQECAKLAIADRYYTSTPGESGINEETQRSAESMMQVCEYKTETSSFNSSFVYTGLQAMRQKTIDGFGAPATVTILDYEVQEDGVVIENRTVEAMELNFQLPNGDIVTAFARGFGQK